MTPPNKWWALLVVLTVGLWAGGAAAQSDDEGGWFEEPGPSERPQLKIQGKGQYDPPPADFRSDPPSVKGPVDGYSENEPGDAADDEDADSQQRAVGEFTPHLASYGYWVDDPYYGRVWVPNRSAVGPDFRPYVSGGHWELTADDEWLWASDYPFGWITFHYGRWAWLSGGSWGWVPGYAYAPAWVDFRVGSNGYVGWGPAPPFSVWRGGVFISLGVRRPVPYIFCPSAYVFSSSMPRYVVYDRHRARSIAAQTTRYRPRYVAGGRVRGPTVREARIPYRYAPTRRVVAEPRGSYVSAYRRGPADRRVQSRAYDAPRESRYRSAPQSRPRDVSGPRGSSTYRGDSYRRGPNPSNVNSGRAAPRWANPPTQDRRWRNSSGDGSRSRSNAGSERRAAPPRARPDAPQGRSASPRYANPPGRESSAGSERRGGGGRSGGASRSAPAQQRSRGDRDGGRGSSR